MSCNHIMINKKLQLAKIIHLENDHTPRKSFYWNPEHSLTNCTIKIALRVTVENKEPTQVEDE